MRVLTRMLPRRCAPIAARVPVAVLLAVMVAACHSGKASSGAAGAAPGGASGAAERDTASTAVLAVRLERGPCFGRCTEYVVELFKDGSIRFDGRRNVKTLGAQRGKIAVSAVRALQQRFTDAGFAKADTAYVEGASGCGRYLPDGPRTVLGLRIGASIKSVQHDAGCTGAPRYLQTLASMVDSVAQTSAWVAGTGANR